MYTENEAQAFNQIII